MLIIKRLQEIGASLSSAEEQAQKENQFALEQKKEKYRGQ
jgi:hypothetical protein